jgi:uncharacterized spore protein YtfJ
MNLMKDIKLFEDLNVEKKVLNPLKIGDRLIFPVVEIVICGNGMIFNSLTISPIAFIIEENSNKYVIPVNENEIIEEEILELFLTLK